MKRKHNGFSLLELLPALALAALILLLLLQFTQTHARHYALEKRKDELENRLRRTEALLRRAVESADTSPVLQPRLHRKGRLTFTDGSPHPALTGTVLHRPLPGTDALSYAVAHPSRSLTVHLLTLRGQSASMHACLRDRARTTAKRFRAVLGLSADGLFELRPPAQGFTLSRSCLSLELSTTRSLLFPQATRADLERIRILIPLDAVETLYLDRNKNLRLLRSSGAVSIENQPLVDGLRRLRLSARVLPAPYRLLEVTAAFGAERRDLTERIWLGSLGRNSLDNVFFNRP